MWCSWLQRTHTTSSDQLVNPHGLWTHCCCNFKCSLYSFGQPKVQSFKKIRKKAAPDKSLFYWPILQTDCSGDTWGGWRSKTSSKDIKYIWKTLKSLQRTKSLELKDLLQPSYLSLLRCVTERQTDSTFWISVLIPFQLC